MIAAVLVQEIRNPIQCVVGRRSVGSRGSLGILQDLRERADLHEEGKRLVPERF